MSRQAGFGLIEALVALFALSVLTAGALALVDATHRMTVAQSAMSELQNNLRVAQQEVVRMLDMAGIGGLPKSIATPVSPATPPAASSRSAWRCRWPTTSPPTPTSVTRPPPG